MQAQVAAVLGDDAVRRQQVDEQAQAGGIEAERAAERLDRAAAALLQAVDQAELEGALQRARIDQGAQEFVDDEELQVPAWSVQRWTLAERVTSGVTLALAGAAIEIFAFGSRSALLLPR